MSVSGQIRREHWHILVESDSSCGHFILGHMKGLFLGSPVKLSRNTIKIDQQNFFDLIWITLIRLWANV